jgi:hypothetical protein
MNMAFGLWSNKKDFRQEIFSSLLVPENILFYCVDRNAVDWILLRKE